MASSKPSASKASTEKQPTLNTVYKAYGGFQNFLHCHGLRMWNHEDVEEGKAIAAEMLKEDADSKAGDLSAQASAKSKTATTPTSKTPNASAQASAKSKNCAHSHLQDRNCERVGICIVEGRDRSHLQDRKCERAGICKSRKTATTPTSRTTSKNKP